jgi:hypothetical protein
MVYRITQKFIRIEAVATRGQSQQDAADPIYLNVCTVRNSDKSIVENYVAGSSVPQIFRVETGTWAFDLNPNLYQKGQSYTCLFKYNMTPNNENVVHQPFIWNPLPSAPREQTNCIVYGLMTDIARNPLPGRTIVLEEYKNFVTLNNRIHQNTLITDAFGYWMLEMPQGAIARSIVGDLIKVFQVPIAETAALREIPVYQPAATQTDTYGYPMPDEHAEFDTSKVLPLPSVPMYSRTIHILESPEINLLTENTVVICPPQGYQLFVDRVGIRLTQLQVSGNATLVQPVVCWGTPTNGTQYRLPIQTMNLNKLPGRDAYSHLESSDASSVFQAQIVTPASGASLMRGVIFFEGSLTRS